MTRNTIWEKCVSICVCEELGKSPFENWTEIFIQVNENSKNKENKQNLEPKALIKDPFN